MYLGLVVKPNAPYKTLDEYLAYAKTHPIKHATQYGTGHQIVMEMVKAKVPGLKIDLVPFKDAAACMTAVLGGHVDSGFAYGGVGKADYFRRLAEGGEIGR